MDKSDKTASLNKRINLDIWRVYKGKSKRYVVVCGAMIKMVYLNSWPALSNHHPE